MLTGVIFSRDRVMQLDATLRSYLLHCQDAALFNLFVLYTSSDKLHAQQYSQLITDFRDYPFIHFVRERNFRSDVLGIMAEWVGLPDWQKMAFRRLLPLGHRLGLLGNILLINNTQNCVLFLVDDNIFVNDFRLQYASQSLTQQVDALGFSLRLGENTLFSYMSDRKQAKPAFTSAAPGIVKYDWTCAENDFAYPLEVSSSIYRIAQILPVLNRRWFTNPNWMESRFAEQRTQFRTSQPQLLCFERSVTFCVPVNRVEPSYQNKAGVNYSYTTQFLAEQYAVGKRLDVSAYSGFTPSSCHQEVEFIFTQVRM